MAEPHDGCCEEGIVRVCKYARGLGEGSYKRGLIFWFGQNATFIIFKKITVDYIIFEILIEFRLFKPFLIDKYSQYNFFIALYYINV